MPTLIIKKGDKTPLSRNFTANEFYSKSADAPASHSFPSELVEAAQLLRDVYGVPFRITSTVRTPAHELLICKQQGLSLKLVETSQHVKRRAMDIQPAANAAQIMAEIQAALINRGKLFDQLRALGVNGFGVYDTFIHLDTRPDPGKIQDEYGSYAFWNNTRLSPKKTTPSPTKRTAAASVTGSYASPSLS